MRIVAGGVTEGAISNKNGPMTAADIKVVKRVPLRSRKQGD